MTISDFLFGCHHKRTTFPQATKPGVRASAVVRQTAAYVVCLDCGKEFAYDWQQMRIVREIRQKPQISGAVLSKAQS